MFFSMVYAALDYYGYDQDVFSLENMVKELVENGKVYSFLWYLKDRWVMDEEDLKECINMILEMKQNMGLQDASLEGE